MPDSRVLRQLVEALLFENVANWSRGPGPNEREIAFHLGQHRYRCRGRIGAFGRVRVTAGSVQKMGLHGPRGATWRDVLADVPGDAAVKSAVADELASTVRLCLYNADHLPDLRQSRRGLDYEELERRLHEGHPYHPCFKARTGFSLDDHAAYGPEAGRPFELRWLALRRSALRQSLTAHEPEFLRAELGDQVLAALFAELTRVGADFTSHGLLPVHPWQLRGLECMPGFVAAHARGELVVLKPELGRFRASQSLRTLLPLERAGASHLKLPLAVRISSSLRTLEPESVRAAPTISRWLQALIEGDPFFAEVASAAVLAEHSSAVYVPASTETAALESNLSAIWREPVARHLHAGEAALPYNALLALEPDGRPFIEPWLVRYGLSGWLRRLLRVTLLPLWRLLVHHGVALEAHAQNLILVERQGLPERLALRDFHDSLEYVPAFLARPELEPDFAALDPRFRGAPAGCYHALASERELGELWTDSLLVFNLCELSWLLEEHYGFGEAAFWKLARSVLAEYRKSSWHEPEREARLQLGPLLRSESLLTCRLRGPSASLFQHTVPNTLHEHAEREIHAGHQ